MNNTKYGAYRCIECSSELNFEAGTLRCGNCSSVYEIRDEIPILTKNERYWCNIPKENMNRLNADAEKSNWRDAISEHINSGVLGHVAAERRADFRCMLPDMSEKRVLDIGSMWGGVTVPLSRHVGEIYAIDTTYETLRFLLTRTRQDTIENIKLALASGHRLPFNEGYFDAVFLVGVLEWLGSHHDFVVTEHYGKNRKQMPAKTKPRKLQMKAISEAYRVLKPGGFIFIAIENRYFYKHFFGAPDPHTAVRFSSILPRFAADIYMRLLKNQNYSEYTYSYFGYRKMLKDAGFNAACLYAALPSYRELDNIIPLDDDACIKYYYRHYGLRNMKGLRKIIPWLMVKFNMTKYLVPSFLVIAEKT